MTRSHLRLLTSHRLEVLADALACRLDERPLGPLERETIVVPSRGMARWVNFHLARTHGIAAGVDFPFPFTWARAAVEALGIVSTTEEAHEPRPPDGFDVASLHWRLHDLLGRLDALDAPADHLRPLRAYLQDDSDLRKRGQLAARLATIFSGYQLQRPLGLRAWEQGRWFGAEADRAGGETWQAPLWRALVGESRGEPLSRALLGAIEGLRAGTIEAERVGPRVEVFGVTSLPPVLLALLEELGKQIEVSLSFVSPTRGYWGDLRARRVPLPPPGLRAADLDPLPPEDAHVIAGPPLLASWGRLARDFHHAVVGLPDAPEVEELAAADPDASTLLGALQQDLLDFVDPSTRSEQERPRFGADDRSLRVHLCHSELREMEVVREEILRAFEDLPHLRPGDVLVLVPDLARYAPFARAVLGRTLELDAGERRLPVRIADGGGALTEGCGRLVLELLQAGRCSADRDRGARSLRDRSLRAALRPRTAGSAATARARARGRGTLGRGSCHACRTIRTARLRGASWREGLDRLLLGFATGAGEELIDGLLPVADATTARVGRIARLTRAFDRLVAVLHGSARPAHARAVGARSARCPARPQRRRNRARGGGAHASGAYARVARDDRDALRTAR
jgi:exodeoxyribonuclease V gamma subunit